MTKTAKLIRKIRKMAEPRETIRDGDQVFECTWLRDTTPTEDFTPLDVIETIVKKRAQESKKSMFT